MVKDGGDALFNAVQVQRVGAGLGALQGQVAVDVPPLAVQDLIEIGGVEAIDAQSTGQSGVDMGMGVHQTRHNDAALGINELRVRVLGLQLRRGAHRRDLGAVDGYAAIGEIGDRLVPGDELAVCQNVHVFSSSYLLLNKRKMLQTLRFETLKHKLSDSCSPCARALRYSYHRIPFCSFIIADFSDDCNGNRCNFPQEGSQKFSGRFVRFDERRFFSDGPGAWHPRAIHLPLPPLAVLALYGQTTRSGIHDLLMVLFQVKDRSKIF